MLDNVKKKGGNVVKDFSFWVADQFFKLYVIYQRIKDINVHFIKYS